VDAQGSHRGTQAAAVAVMGVPGILLAHLLTTGVTVGLSAVLAVSAIVLVVAALLPVRSTRGLALVTAATQLAGHTVLTLAAAHGSAPSGCIPAVGRGASLGLRLALLQADVTCPTGTLAPGPAAGVTAAALSAVLAALTILAGHAAAAGLTGLMLTAVRHAARAGRELGVLAGTLAAMPTWIALLFSAARRPVRVAAGDPPTHRADVVPLSPQHRPGTVARRGPPSWCGRTRLLALA
jgi:hypothetical protein